jgi:hypothetical protein
LLSTREIRVSILDENDNNPKLASNNYRLTVHENNVPGAEVFHFNATDADTGQNAELVFSMRLISSPSHGSNTMPEALSIDRTTGRVTTQVSFDYESETRDFAYLVTVSDRGEIPRSATATLQVGVADINDQKPRFERSSYYITTAENQPIGSSVGRVNATDGDRTVQFNRVFYNILSSSGVSGAADADTFTVDRYTGIIRNVKRLDREQHSVYVFTVTASNEDGVTTRGHGDVADYADVTVYVDDVNDNRPVFVFPGPHRGRTVDLPSRYAVSISSTITKVDIVDNNSWAPVSQFTMPIMLWKWGSYRLTLIGCTQLQYRLLTAYH